jgi:hypothetical protein
MRWKQTGMKRNDIDFKIKNTLRMYKFGFTQEMCIA